MDNRLRTALLALSLIGVSCSDPAKEQVPSAPGKISVTIGSGPRIEIEPQSRTAIDEDGVTIRWADEDKIALWAVTDRDTPVFGGAEFSLWHYNTTFRHAKFRGEIPVMEPGTYTYLATSPVPAAVSGTLASYDIPAVQDGTFDGAYDVMVATPVQGPALLEGDNSDAVRMAFRHKVHVLKIHIPSNALGEPVSQLEIAFPQPVTGRLTVDAADPDAEAVLTDGSSLLTLRFAQPVEAGATVYATIAPADLSQELPIVITASGETRASKPGTFAGKNFLAGHTTPIRFFVPETQTLFTRLRFTLTDTGEGTLGERISSFTLSADGARFDNGESARTFEVTGAGDYFLNFRENPEALQGREITVSYESENALVSNSVVLPATFVAETVNDAATLSVPYLLEEDFRSIDSFGSDDNPKVGGTDVSSGDRTGIDLTAWGLTTEGWTSARVGAEAGKAVRICARYEGQSLAKNTYNARIDSAPFRGIKAGRSVHVRVSYDYKGGRWSMIRKGLFGGDGGSGNGHGVYGYGYTTEAGWQGGSVAIPHPIRSNITLPGTEGANRKQEQNYDSIDQSGSFVIPAAGNTHRASWMVSTTMNDAPFSGCNGNFWLYLDNVRVSIAND